MKVVFTVLGDTTGKGRPKFVRATGRTYTPKKTANYEQLVQMEYQAQVGMDRFFEKDVALAMKVTVYRPIVKSAGKMKTELMLAGTILPGKKPDFDNIGKVICDALNGIAFHDDAQIVDGRVIKRYAEQPRVEVEIWEVGKNG